VVDYLPASSGRVSRVFAVAYAKACARINGGCRNWYAKRAGIEVHGLTADNVWFAVRMTLVAGSPDGSGENTAPKLPGRLREDLLAPHIPRRTR